MSGDRLPRGPGGRRSGTGRGGYGASGGYGDDPFGHDPFGPGGPGGGFGPGPGGPGGGFGPGPRGPGGGPGPDDGFGDDPFDPFGPRGPGGGFGGRRGPGGPGSGGPGRRGPGGGGGRRRGPDRPGPRKRSILWRMRRPLFLIGLAMLAALAGVGVVFARTELPAIGDLTQSSYICAADVAAGKCSAQNAMARLKSDEDRTNVPISEVPPIVIKAVIAMEDRDFYHHDGINPMGIARAFYQDAKGGGVSQGGSTITQQYVKNAFKLSRERALSRKVKEAFLSIKLEQQMSKKQILEGYLNTIYFGRGAYGIGAAAQAYFGKDVKQLGGGEAALLAGLIRAPTLAEPTKYPKEATRRRHTALVAMREEGYITDAEYTLFDAIRMAPPFIRPYSTVKLVDTMRGASDPDYMGTDYLPQYISQQLKAIDPVRFNDETINTGGLRIYTSINYDMQRAAWQAVTSTLNHEDDPKTPQYEGDPEAALVSIDDQGLVRAMVASRHHYTPKKYEVNYAVRGNGSSGRQPGSTFKPIVLSEALREGYSLKSRFDALGHVSFPELGDNGKPWEVSNYSESAEGVMDLAKATAQSSNTAYAQLMVSLGINPVPAPGGGTVRQGPEKVATLAKAMGIGGKQGISVRDTVPSLVLGINNATPLEMAGAYTTFANRGVFKKPDIITRVEQVDQEGRATVLYTRQVHQSLVLSQSQADLVTYALQGVLKPGATGAGAALGKPAAGKTGTSQENQNAWFTGFVPKLTTSVWMGYPNAGDGSGWDNPKTPGFDDAIWPMNFKGRPVQGRAVTGGSFPAQIWKKYMMAATGNSQDQFVEPTPDQINSGEVINQNSLRTSDEVPLTTPPIVGQPPLPGPTLPRRPGAPKPTQQPSTTIILPETTSSTSPGPTTTAPGGPGPPGHG